jgi:geranylgeranyl pyrophosphate synthase
MKQSEAEDAAIEVIEKRGRSAMEKAKQEILNTQYDNGAIASALKYYVKTSLPLVMPIFPALMSLAYEATKKAKTKKEKIEPVAAAMALIAFSADIHDDIIDKSTLKFSNKTVYGKFGDSIALLAGDSLLIQGTTLLQQACEPLTSNQRLAISNLIPQTLFQISTAEALEIKLRKKEIINPKEYLEITRLKGVVAETQCLIGGILAQANEDDLKAIGDYGRTIGMLGTVKDEFCDTLNLEELEHRIKYECPPLPMIYAYQDDNIRKEIKVLIQEPNTSKRNLDRISNLILKSDGTLKLKREINQQINQELKNRLVNEEKGVGKEASLLLKALTEGT